MGLKTARPYSQGAWLGLVLRLALWMRKVFVVGGTVSAKRNNRLSRETMAVIFRWSAQRD